MTRRHNGHDESRASTVRVIVIQPDEQVPLGRFSNWLQHYGADITLIQPFAGDKVPSEVEADALIVLGGTMTAHSLEQFPWLADIKALYRQAAEADLPVLGICLGAQLLTVAFDGEVTSNSPIGPEIGVVEVERTEYGASDPAVEGLAQSFRTTSFHYDGISALPQGAVLMGRGQRYPNQVFRLGNAVGVQFHPEASPELFKNWCAADVIQRPELAEDFERSMSDVDAADEEIASSASLLARNFINAIHAALKVQHS